MCENIFSLYECSIVDDLSFNCYAFFRNANLVTLKLRIFDSSVVIHGRAKYNNGLLLDKIRTYPGRAKLHRKCQVIVSCHYETTTTSIRYLQCIRSEGKPPEEPLHIRVTHDCVK